MSETLNNLAKELVTPERFGAVALSLALLPGEALEPTEVAQVIPFPQLKFDLDPIVA